MFLYDLLKTLLFRVAFLFTLLQAYNTLAFATSPPDTLTLWDAARMRAIPIACYLPEITNEPKALVILSHGYAENHPMAYLSYRYLAEFLANKGFWVVSIQHELPTDSLMPTAGKPQMVRLPFWERGAANIYFVLQTLRQRNELPSNLPIVLLGHSNGGDMSALFAKLHPNQVKQLITLDNRRMALPRNVHLPVLSLRSCDQPTDEGVLPNLKELEAFPIRLVKLAQTSHHEMSDQGSERRKAEIQSFILKFLTP